MKTDKKTVSYAEGRRRAGAFWRNDIRMRHHFHPAQLSYDAWDHTPFFRNQVMGQGKVIAPVGAKVVAPTDNHGEIRERHTTVLFAASDGNW